MQIQASQLLRQIKTKTLVSCQVLTRSTKHKTKQHKKSHQRLKKQGTVSPTKDPFFVSTTGTVFKTLACFFFFLLSSKVLKREVIALTRGEALATEVGEVYGLGGTRS